MTNFMSNPFFVIIGVGLSSFTIVYLNAERIITWLRDQSLGNREYVIQRLDIMFVEINKRRITGAMLMLSFGIGGLVFAALWPHVLLGLGCAAGVTVIGWRLPKIFVNVYYGQRASKF